ncbi:hypothetical protein AiwAL_05885 [Acidiphilium sp. AL]|uniref:hypothetical protein n=1 Tax=Acidiphilium sp. AL TaxID=2871704 RepID=UPI0021CAF435|nr:hypothetical protein [Acidiphilium sp. AL]MCU4159633.1 hypothetical protein [Acidiphilium sp. AL]
MNDKERLEVLERALAQMLKPIRNIPFSVIVKSLAECAVVKFDLAQPADKRLLKTLKTAIQFCAKELQSTPIERPRPNEVGNDVEPYVMRALEKAGLSATRPTSRGGAGKSTGYPDIMIRDQDDRATYIECKIFAQGSIDTTMRSFYLSPSESFKVAVDAGICCWRSEWRPHRSRDQEIPAISHDRSNLSTCTISSAM